MINFMPQIKDNSDFGKISGVLQVSQTHKGLVVDILQGAFWVDYQSAVAVHHSLFDGHDLWRSLAALNRAERVGKSATAAAKYYWF